MTTLLGLFDAGSRAAAGRAPVQLPHVSAPATLPSFADAMVELLGQVVASPAAQLVNANEAPAKHADRQLSKPQQAHPEAVDAVRPVLVHIAKLSGQSGVASVETGREAPSVAVVQHEPAVWKQEEGQSSDPVALLTSSVPVLEPPRADMSTVDLAVPVAAESSERVRISVPVELARGTTPLGKLLAHEHVEPRQVAPARTYEMARADMHRVGDTAAPDPAPALRSQLPVQLPLAAAPVRLESEQPVPTEQQRGQSEVGIESAMESVEKTQRTLSAAMASAEGVPEITYQEPLRLPGAKPEAWKPQLMRVLGDRIEVQSSSGVDHAVVRLDPPHLGRVEIVVRHEAGSVQVHLSATHSEVARQLQQIGDSIRQDLAGRFGGEVSVQVTDAGRHGEGRHPSRPFEAQPEAEPGKGLAEAGGSLKELFALATEVNQT